VIGVISEDPPAPVSPCHDVVDSAFKLDPWLAVAWEKASRVLKKAVTRRSERIVEKKSGFAESKAERTLRA